MRLAFERVGAKCVFTSEWDSYCRQTYGSAFPDDSHPIVGDIRQVCEEDIPDHDILLAGFPCQPFSIAGVSKKNALGRPHGFACVTQGTLFFDVARILRASRPRAFLLENVKNLVSHDRGNTFRIIRQTLRDELGYSLVWRVLDGGQFVPQHRERILMVGFRDDCGFDFSDMDPPALNGPPPVMRSILHREDGTELDRDGGRYLDPQGKVREKYVLSDRLWRYLQDYAAKHRSKGNGFGYGLVGPDDRARTLSARYYKDGSEILVDRGAGRNPRRLTPRECARLMGFPDTFPIVVSDTRAYKQFGNSVVVPLIEHIARRMVVFLQGAPCRKPYRLF
jgi:DNA (cytosine-5)-methyltransferase 1